MKPTRRKALEMPLTVPLIGRELCFWCVEIFQKCPIHKNSNVFWNDVAVKCYSEESDGFRIVNENQLINVERCVQYTEDGKFILPPNSSSLPIFSTFHFEKLKEITAPYVLNEERKNEKKQKSPTHQKLPKNQKSKVTKKSKYSEREEVIKKKNVYSKIHKNAIKTIASEYKPGKKCDQSQKLFLCDICEFSFTLRHNLQVHLVQFHGKTENIPEEKVAVLKEVFPRKMTEEETLE